MQDSHYFDFDRLSGRQLLNVAGRKRNLFLIPGTFRRRFIREARQGLPQSIVVPLAPGKAGIIEWSDTEIRRYKIDI